MFIVMRRMFQRSLATVAQTKSCFDKTICWIATFCSFGSVPVLLVIVSSGDGPAAAVLKGWTLVSVALVMLCVCEAIGSRSAHLRPQLIETPSRNR
jgi:hypothetical protein